MWSSLRGQFREGLEEFCPLLKRIEKVIGWRYLIESTERTWTPGQRFCVYCERRAELGWFGVQILVKWWADCPADLLERRVVKPLQQYLTDELFVTKKLTVSVMNVIKVLAKVEEANQLGRKLPPEAFYNELIRY